MVKSLTELIARKNAERDKWLEGTGVATDPTVVQALVEKAVKCSKEASEATTKLIEARKELDSIDQHRASYDQVLDRLALVNPDGIHNMTTEEQRVLLDLIGLRVVVSPANAGANRIEVEYRLRSTQVAYGTVHRISVTAPR